MHRCRISSSADEPHGPAPRPPLVARVPEIAWLTVSISPRSAISATSRHSSISITSTGPYRCQSRSRPTRAPVHDTPPAGLISDIAFVPIASFPFHIRPRPSRPRWCRKIPTELNLPARSAAGWAGPVGWAAFIHVAIAADADDEARRRLGTSQHVGGVNRQVGARSSTASHPDILEAAQPPPIDPAIPWRHPNTVINV
jgi:hypothetical protein